MLKRICACVLTLMLLCFSAVPASAADSGELKPGTYYMTSYLSCYINAMGGVEFGAPLLKYSQLEVSADGSKTMTLFFTKSSVTIYNVTCDTFIDVSPYYVSDTGGVKSGTLGFYNKSGVLKTENVSYTLSNDTAENAQGEQVHYVDSFSFPVEYISDAYNLSLFVNSNVMGTQFTMDGYPAVLSVDWSAVSTGGSADDGEDTKAPDKEAVPEENTTDVESKNGLNIYRADDKSESSSDTEASDAYIAHFKQPLLTAVGIAAGVMIIAGAALMISGRKEK